MKKTFLIILLLLAATSYAGQKAITDTGETVILNDDGTWVYSNDVKKTAVIIKTNKRKFVKPKGASFLLKSKKNSSAFWVDTHRWTFKKEEAGAAGEYEFQLKGGDLYGAAITEAIPMPIETLVDVAFLNAKDAAPDSKIVRKEYRVVNGKKLIYMEMNGTIQGINFSYFGYYYSDASGSTQFLTYTSSTLVSRYKSDINDILNGLDVQ
ncbi:hypothetical protein ACFL7E_08425 [Thermodesulfobacteriota bacterium]